MEQNVLTTLFLPLALGIIMFGMGLSLSIEDFKRVTIFPKAVFVGIFNQLLILPLIGLLVITILPIEPVLAVGVMVLAFCPGGATSNLITNISRGDTALSITLTAITSIVTIFTIPFLINFSSENILGIGQYVALPVGQTMLQILFITALPVGFGMGIKRYFPGLSQSAEKPVKIASAIFIVIIILGAIVKERDNLVPFFIQAGPAAFLLNVISMGFGYFSARYAGLNLPQSISICIESGIQNGTLGIAITAGLLNNGEMAIPAAIYSLIMFVNAGAFSLISNKIIRMEGRML